MGRGTCEAFEEDRLPPPKVSEHAAASSHGQVQLWMCLSEPAARRVRQGEAAAPSQWHPVEGATAGLAWPAGRGLAPPPFPPCTGAAAASFTFLLQRGGEDQSARRPCQKGARAAGAGSGRKKKKSLRPVSAPATPAPRVTSAPARSKASLPKGCPFKVLGKPSKPESRASWLPLPTPFPGSAGAAAAAAAIAPAPPPPPSPEPGLPSAPLSNSWPWVGGRTQLGRAGGLLSHRRSPAKMLNSWLRAEAEEGCRRSS